MLLVNSGGHPWITDEFGGLNVPPGGQVEIADGYCKASVARNGSRWPSIVERLAPFMVPADETLRATWGHDLPVPEMRLEPTPEQLAADLINSGTAPAIAELMAAGDVEPPKGKPGRKPKVRP